MESSSPRNINSAKPFLRAYEAYRDAGWLGTIPLPAGQKFPPPTGWTGKAARHPEQDDIDAWLEKPKYKNANIGLHLGECPGVESYDIIGIDVDNYGDKRGGEQLKRLEAEYGKLLPTWVSSSRPMPSGIRFYRVPTGFAFRGKAAAAIDIIQKAHRYAVVWPSHNPDSEAQYGWIDPDGNVCKGGLEDIPDVSQLPILSPDDPATEEWFNFLTQGGMAATEDDLDMDLSVSEIERWAKVTFRKAPSEEDEVCSRMQEAVGYWQEMIETEESSHDKITAAHWNLIALGSEGHYDWSLAVKAVEGTFVTNTVQRGKRNIHEVKNEVMRSRINAIRKLKAQIDSGKRAVVGACPCFTEEIDFDAFQRGFAANNPGLAKSAAQRAELSGGDISNDSKISGMPSCGNDLSAPADFSMDDDGNAAHWLAMYRGHAHYIPEYDEWIMWNGTEWVQGEGMARRSYFRVKDRQSRYAAQLRGQAYQLGLADDPEAKRMKALADRWSRWAERSGMSGPKDMALKTAADHSILHESELNNEPYLMGVANGVLKLHDDGSVSLNDMTKDHFITLNTGVEYVPWAELGEDAQLLEDVLEQWIPDPELRNFVQKLAGYSLLGDNRERIAIWLKGATGTGKSTFLNTFMAALGDYAGTVDLSIFRGDRHTNPALVSALPRRIITASEASQANILHADVFKRITGGEPISAELKYSNDIISRVPAFTPWVATNSTPTMHGADAAVRRRIVVASFNNPVAENPGLGYRLRTSPGVRVAMLSWAIRGWALYCAEGLGIAEAPESVADQGDEFASNLSDIGTFVSECIERSKLKVTDNKWPAAWKLPVDEAFDAYEKWCFDNRTHERDKLSRRRFTTQMQDLGIEYRMVRVSDRPTRCFVGVALKGLRPTKLEF